MCLCKEYFFCLCNRQSISSCIILQIICYFMLPPVLNLLFWYHLLVYILDMYYRQRNQCCNPTDHIRLPIIHTKTYIHNRDKRQEQVDRITYYISMRGSIQYRELNRVLIWLNNLIYYDLWLVLSFHCKHIISLIIYIIYKIFQERSCSFQALEIP